MNRPTLPTTPQGDSPDERDLSALLHTAGPRECAPQALEAQVRAAVAAEWRATVEQRRQHLRRRRLVVPGLAAAAVATVAMAVWLAQPLLRQAAAPVASVALLSGPVQVRHGDDEAWQVLDTAASIRPSDTLQTAANGRVALRWSTGIEMRLDRATEIVVADAEGAKLNAGAVYVDSGAAKSSPDSRTFVVKTSAGEVRHLGTQYAVRTAGPAVQVSVREGLVAIDRGSDRVIGSAGEQLSLSPGAAVVRTRLPIHDAQWAWIQTITPPFAIENRSLDEFLTWAARQTGRRLVYASRTAANEAESVRLKGSVAGLAPDAAVLAVGATTPSLRIVRGESELRVEQAGP